MSFDRGSEIGEIFASRDLDLDAMGKNIVDVYNDISEGCYELFQRRLLSSKIVFTELLSDSVDTYWASDVVCNNACPVEDLLFGIDSPDPISRLLEGFVPGAEPATNSPENSNSVVKIIHNPVAQYKSFQINETPLFSLLLN